MSKFKVGDRVRIKKYSCGPIIRGEIYPIGTIDGSLYALHSPTVGCSCWDNMELVEEKSNLSSFMVIDDLIRSQMTFQSIDWINQWIKKDELTINKTFMEKLSIIAKKTFDADTKTLIEAGYLDTNLNLTSKAIEQINALAFAEKKAELVVLAQSELDEAKKK